MPILDFAPIKIRNGNLSIASRARSDQGEPSRRGHRRSRWKDSLPTSRKKVPPPNDTDQVLAMFVGNAHSVNQLQIWQQPQRATRLAGLTFVHPGPDRSAVSGQNQDRGWHGEVPPRLSLQGHRPTRRLPKLRTAACHHSRLSWHHVSARTAPVLRGSSGNRSPAVAGANARQPLGARWPAADKRAEAPD